MAQIEEGVALPPMHNKENLHRVMDELVRELRLLNQIQLGSEEKYPRIAVMLLTEAIDRVSSAISSYQKEEKQAPEEPKVTYKTVDLPDFSRPLVFNVFANPGAERLAFKVVNSHAEYRIKPGFGFVEPGAAILLEITRTAGAPKEDKLVIQFALAPADATDPATAFAAAAPAGSVTIPISAT